MHSQDLLLSDAGAKECGVAVGPEEWACRPYGVLRPISTLSAREFLPRKAPAVSPSPAGMDLLTLTSGDSFVQ